MFEKVLERLYMFFLVMTIIGLVTFVHYKKNIESPLVGCRVIFIDDTDMYLICKPTDTPTTGINDTVYIEINK